MCQIWSSRDFKPVKTLSGHEAKVTSLDVSGGKYIVLVKNVDIVKKFTLIAFNYNLLLKKIPSYSPHFHLFSSKFLSTLGFIQQASSIALLFAEFVQVK